MLGSLDGQCRPVGVSCARFRRKVEELCYVCFVKTIFYAYCQCSESWRYNFSFGFWYIQDKSGTFMDYYYYLYAIEAKNYCSLYPLGRILMVVCFRSYVQIRKNSKSLFRKIWAFLLAIALTHLTGICFTWNGKPKKLEFYFCTIQP